MNTSPSRKSLLERAAERERLLQLLTKGLASSERAQLLRYRWRIRQAALAAVVGRTSERNGPRVIERRVVQYYTGG